MKSWENYFLIPFISLGLLSAATAQESSLKVFDRIWQVAKDNIHPASKVKLFTDSKYEKIQKRITGQCDTQCLAKAINPFLISLNLSHTYLYESTNIDYYFFRSLFSTHNSEIPKLHHIGAQYLKASKGYIVRTVLQGYPAEKVGLRRGDIVIKVNNKDFDPVSSFSESSKVYNLSFQRGSRTYKADITPVFEAIPASFIKATKNSAKIISEGNKSIGYVQLWTGAFGTEKILSDLVKNKFKKIDGLILDLRDGFGAAWWDHLDPFFSNRVDYFVATTENRDGTIEINKPDQKNNKNSFLGPMVVLINEDVRSGKEAMAFQFKKSRRAKLIGKTTAGAFVSGRGFFADEDNGYILYLAISAIKLDGQIIEGVGIAPDLRVNYPFKGLDHDPQLSEGLGYIKNLISNRS